MSDFFDMGGYGLFVWTTYAAAVVLMGGLLVVSVRGARRSEREVRAMEALSPRRRRRQRANTGHAPGTSAPASEES